MVTSALLLSFFIAKAESKSLDYAANLVNHSTPEASEQKENYKVLRLTPEEASRVLESSQFNGESVDVKQVAQDIIIIIYDDGSIVIIIF